MSDIILAWWNLENLFDVVHSANRPAWLEDALKNDLDGWTQTILDKKISQLSSIICGLNNNKGPDILGICEVENKPVVDQLAQSLQPLGRNYAVEHHDTSDQRGIDVAFIYDADLFKAEAQFFYVVQKRTGTRDLFQVNFRLKASNKHLILIGNHWPSRSGGELESEPFRIQAGETLGYWVERIPDKSGELNVGIVLMGDFNDEPFNRSVMNHALGTNSETKILKAKNPYSLNLMWPFLGRGLGTFYYDSTPNVLDQFMISKSILNGQSGFKVKKNQDGSYKVTIEMNPAMMKDGKPVPFGRPNKNLNQAGCSDHFPISVQLTEIEVG